jgi:hypothetical protein
VKLAIPTNTLKRLLFVTWGIFVVVGGFAEAFRYLFDERPVLSRFLSLSCEQNAPTWYVSSLLLLCAVLLALIALAKRQDRAAYVPHWWFLAASFLYISLDETVTIHEKASKWFDYDGILHFGWVIPASAVVVVLGLAYLKFLAHLPSRTRWQFICAGAVYVGGALGVEFILGYWTDIAGSKNLTYGMIDLVEESMELGGVTLFLCSLLECVAGPEGQLQIDLQPRRSAVRGQTNEATGQLRIAS